MKIKKNFIDGQDEKFSDHCFASKVFDLAVFRLARHVMVRPGQKKFALGLLDKLPSFKERLRKIVAGRPALATDPKEGTAPLERNLFVDVSSLAAGDGKTGIPRVTRGILFPLMENPPEGFRVVPVFATKRRPGFFVMNGLDPGTTRSKERFYFDPEVRVPIDLRCEDLFLCLDYNPPLMNIQRYYLAEIQRAGVEVYSVVHDLLPIQMPDKCPPGLNELHARWLRSILRFNGAVCVSRTVAGELDEWILREAPERKSRFQVGWFRLGSDFENFPPLSEPEYVNTGSIRNLPAKPFFLMVGTLEARKGYSQALEAFEILWEQGENLSLVIAGREGWLVEELAWKIRDHEESGKRLFWFEDLDDPQLLELYRNCTALLMASRGEGFGLPLVEAARLGVPIITRDLPVLREVTGDHAFFFRGDSPADLADSISEWFSLFVEARHPGSDDVPWISWEESAQYLVEVISDLQKKQGSFAL